MTVPKAVLLDLDDTIVAASVLSPFCWEEVCRQFARRLDNVSPDGLHGAVMDARAWFWGDPERHRTGRLDVKQARREIAALAFEKLTLDNTALAYDMADAFSRMRLDLARPFPGAIETVESLRAQDVRLALVTNGGADIQRLKIERNGLARFFDCIVIEGEFGVGKPDPRVYRHVLDILDARPCDTWMVGDNLEWDVAAPQRLGIRAVWVDSRSEGLPPDSLVRPDHTIHALSDLDPLWCT